MMLIERIKNRLLFEKHEIPKRINFLLKLYKFDPDKYQESFISELEYKEKYIEHSFNNVVYCFWTGYNQMSEVRKACLESMNKNLGVPVKLISPQNLQKYILPNHPLHEGYKFLSDVHKSDYLRAYFMHHYGGGYSDIKMQHQSWEFLFDQVRNNPNKYIMGYHEASADVAAPVSGIVEKDLKKHYRYLIGNGGYIAKPYTPFTYAWITQQNQILDRKYSQLKAIPGNTLGDNLGYALKWTEILGDIFHPLCLKFHKNLLYNEKLRYTKVPYR